MGPAYILAFSFGMNLLPLIFYIIAIVLRKKKTTPWVVGGVGLLLGAFSILRRFSAIDPSYLAAASLLLFLLLTVLTLIFLIIGSKKAEDEDED